MPIYVASSLSPRSGNTYFLVEDKYLKGGIQIVADTAARDAIDPFNRKVGMMALALADMTVYTLNSDLSTWSELLIAPKTHTHPTTAITTDATHNFVTDTQIASWNIKQDAIGFVPANSAERGIPNGYASLDASGKLPVEQLPDLALTDVYVVNSEAEMLALNCQVGDVCVRVDLTKTYILKTSISSQLSSWQQILSPTDGVLSIAVGGALQNTGTATSPVINLPMATQLIDGAMSSADKLKLDTLPADANNYVHPTGDGNLHVPATGSDSNGKVLTAGSAPGVFAWQTPADAGLQSVSANAPLQATTGLTPVITLPKASDVQDGYLSATDWSAFNAKGSGAVDTVSGTGAITVTGTASAPVVGISDATTSAAGAMSAVDKQKLDGIAVGATAYAHPTGDGNLHIPATGTTNDGKVLMAGATEGSVFWALPALGSVTNVSAVTPIAVANSATTPEISIAQASASSDGYLSASDWNIFNNKGVGNVTSVSGSGPISITNPTTTPDISIADATTTTAGAMSAADKAKLDGISAGATNYALPVASSSTLGGVKIGTGLIADGDGTINVTATGVTNLSNTPSSTAVQLNSSSGAGTTIAAADASIAGVMSSADKVKLDGISANATSVTSTSQLTNDANYITLADVPIHTLSATAPIALGGTTVSPIIGVNEVTTTTSGVMSAEDKVKLDGITAGATAYSHPTGDGNLHVPATGTTNSGKVLTAGATAGSLSWTTASAGTVTNVSGTGAVSVTNQTTTPSISVADATTSSAGLLTAADKTKLDGIAAGATAYTHPTGDGNLHVPATGTTNSGKVLTAGATAGSLSWTTSAAGTVTNVTGNAPLVVVNNNSTPAISIPAATSSVDGYLKATDWVVFNSKGSGIVQTISGSGALSAAGTTAVTLSLADATTSVSGALSAADKTKLDGIATGATNYVHPTGDGNLHVPATSTTNSGKVLTAGATAGSLSWATPATGSVTSVGGTGTVSGLTLSGTVTSTGNLTLGGTLSVTPSNFASQTANYVLIAPNGSAGAPTFRALVAADIPTLNQNTTGSAGSVVSAVTFATSGGAAAGSTYNGSTARTVDYSTVGAAASSHVHSAATTSVDGFLSAADKTKLDGIAASANNYVHPTGDGNLHVPATGTTNNGKFLMAGATAGSLSWGTAGSGTVTSVGGTGTASGLTLSGTVTSTGNLTLSGTVNSLDTTANYQMNSLGVGTAAAGTAGDIRATGDVTAFYSDERLKDVVCEIPEAIAKVMMLRGVIYHNNDVAKSFGYTSDAAQVGVLAQDVLKVMPEVVVPAPFDIGQNEDGSEYSKSGENYLTVKYERLVPLLIEALKDQQSQIAYLKQAITAHSNQAVVTTDGSAVQDEVAKLRAEVDILNRALGYI